MGLIHWLISISFGLMIAFLFFVNENLQSIERSDASMFSQCPDAMLKDNRKWSVSSVSWSIQLLDLFFTDY